MMKMIIKGLVGFGSILGGAFAASILMVLVAQLRAQDLGRTIQFLETVRMPVAVAGGLLGALVFALWLKRQRKEEARKRSPNQAVHAIGAAAPQHDG